MRTATQLQTSEFDAIHANPGSERRLKSSRRDDLALAMADALADILREERRTNLEAR